MLVYSTDRLGLAPARRDTLLIAATAISYALLVFAIDLRTPLGFADGAVYLVLPLFGLLGRSCALTLALCILGTGLTGLGYFVSPPGGESAAVLYNRFLPAAGLWVAGLMALACLRAQLRQETRLLLVANLDPLTQTFNRRYLLAELENRLKDVTRHDYPLCVMMLDMDLFKSINDEYGHIAGDQALETACGVIRKALRTNDILGRYGGEEFLVVMPFTDLNGAKILAERIRGEIEAARPLIMGHAVTFTVSIGVARFDPATMSSVELIQAADDALYTAKSQGRNRVVLAFGPGSDVSLLSLRGAG